MTPTLRQLVDKIPNLGSSSGVVGEIQRVLNQPHSSLADLGDVIEKDPDLTARLLKLGNSAFFGFPNRLETVAEAVSVIGIQQVVDLIVAASVVELFAGIAEDLADMDSFWRHALACGVGARCLAIARQMPKAEAFFVAGLLHDLGRLVLYTRAPEQAVEVFRRYRGRRMLLRQAEVEVLGFDHAQLGETLMRAWHYPASLVNAVAYHHQPMAAGLYQLESALVHLADYLAHALELGHSGERFVPPLSAKAWERVGLPASALDSILRSIDEQTEIVEEALLDGPRKSAPGHPQASAPGAGPPGRAALPAEMRP